MPPQHDATPLILLVVLAPVAAQWTEMGTSPLPGGAGSTATDTSLAVSRLSNLPLVAYADGDNSDQLSVLSFDGSSWSAVGTRGLSTAAVSQVTLGLSGNTDEPYVAVLEANQPNVYKYDALTTLSWGLVGSTLGQTFLFATEPRLAMRKVIDFQPFVVTMGMITSPLVAISAFVYDGANWNLVGAEGEVSNGGTASQIALTLDASDTPFVAYRSGSTFVAQDTLLSVVTWDGSNWVPLGGSYGISSGAAWHVSIIASSTSLYISYMDEDVAGDPVMVLEYDGTSYNVLSSPGNYAETAGTRSTSLAVDSSGQLYMAYRDGDNSFFLQVRPSEAYWGDAFTAPFATPPGHHPNPIPTAQLPRYLLYQSAQPLPPPPADGHLPMGRLWGGARMPSMCTCAPPPPSRMIMLSCADPIPSHGQVKTYDASNEWFVTPSTDAGTGLSSGAIHYSSIAIGNDNNIYVRCRR